MSFWSRVNSMNLDDFRPGIRSKAEIGDNVIVAVMEIGPGKEDNGHQHPFEQCGIVTHGKIEMTVGEEQRVLEALDAYYIPSGILHGWKTFDKPVRIMDVSVKHE